jgi:endonuclease/exonuclease/phosphatase family metal-dependent hydrolase
MRAALSAVLLLFAATMAPAGGRFVVLSYNVQNLFDARADGTEYREFTPPRWGPEAAEAKLAAVGAAIRRAAASPLFGRAPDLVALQEVENLEVLERLRDRYLADLGYRYAVLVSQPGVATQTAFLSRLPVVRSAVHPVGEFRGLPLRHVLEIEVRFQGRRLVVLNNHWKSKTGGTDRTSAARRRAAAAVAGRVRELLQEDPAADVLVLGDLNENVEEYREARGRYLPALLPWEELSAGAGGTAPAEVGRLILCPRPELCGDGPAGLGLYEPWYELPPQARGSSVYQGLWQTPDHLLMSPGLFDGRGFDYRAGSFRVVRRRTLVHPHTGYPVGFRPAPGGGRGTSDHLPLLIELEMAGPARP